MSFLGHVLRKEEMEHLVVTGFVDGKRARGRQRETFLAYLGKFTNKPPMELLRLAKDRVVCRITINVFMKMGYLLMTMKCVNIFGYILYKYLYK